MEPEPIDLVRSFLGIQHDPYAPSFDMQLNTHLQKYTDLKPHNVASYFFHTFLAFVFTIPETSLSKELGIEKILFKEMENRAGLKFVFLLKNQGPLKSKKVMAVRNVFLKPVSKDWERGLTSYEYQGLKTSLANRRINLDTYDRNIAEYAVRQEKLYEKDMTEHDPERKASVFVQELYTEKRMIATEKEVAGPRTDFRIVMRLNEALDNHRDLPIDALITGIQQAGSNVYELRMRSLISYLRQIYVSTRDRYNLKYDTWNGADCGFMFGTFLAIQGKLELLPVVRHIMILDELDAPSKDLYGRFYLSLTPKRSLARTNIDLYLKHKPVSMTFIQDIPVPEGQEQLREDYKYLEKYTYTNKVHKDMLRLKMDFFNRFDVTHHSEGDFEKHTDFLQKCHLMYEQIFKFQLEDGRQKLIDHVSDVLDMIWRDGLTRSIHDTNYLSRYFLAMLFSMKDRNEWSVFVQNDPEKMKLVLESKANRERKMIFEFIENPMQEHFTESSHVPPEEIAGGKTLHVIIRQDFLHTKDELVDPDTASDFVTRKISVVATNEQIPEDNLISVDAFDVGRTLRENDQEIVIDDLRYLLHDFHLFINDKHHLEAFVDGLFHDTTHAKNILPLRSYHSHSQISHFHGKEGDSDLGASHLNFIFSDDKDSEFDRKRGSMASLKKATKNLKGSVINVLVSNDPRNIQLEDMVQVSHSKTSGTSCFGRRRRSGHCTEDIELEELLPTDEEISDSPLRVSETLKTIGEVSGHVMSAVMLRDFISDLIREDTGAAVRDGTFFAGSIFSHKLASSAENYGATLIKENRALLGNSLRYAAPVLRRLTSAYVLNHLIDSIEALNKNNNDTAAMVNIGVDSTFLTIDVAETSIEVMELFGVQAVEGLSATTEPIGMAIGAVLILGSNVYETVKKMQAINAEISLSPTEEVTETLRAFFHLDPSQEVQNEMSEYEANEHIAAQIKAQLNNQGKFKYYITSSGKMKNGKLQLMSDTIVDLQGKETVVKSKSNPRNVDLICSQSTTISEYKKGIQKEKSFWKKIGSYFEDIYWSVRTLIDATRSDFKSLALDIAKVNPEDLDTGYVCHNAFGIINPNAETESAFYQLGNGYDRVHGLLDSQNVFNISSGQKVIYGGNSDDYFLISGKTMTGLLDGNHGEDTLDLSKFNPRSEIQINSTKVTSGNWSFAIINVNRIVGRLGMKERIEGSCDLTFVDSKGGQNYDATDLLFFKNETCSYNVTVVLSSFTDVSAGNVSGNFSYFVSPGAHHVSVSISGGATHDINFDFPFTSDLDWNLDNNTLKIMNKGIQILTLAGQMKNSTLTFQDGVRMKIESGRVVTLLNTDHSIMTIIEKYDTMLQSKNITMIAYSKLEKQSIVFNHGKYMLRNTNNQSIHLNVIHNDVQHESHIVCTEGENLVLIKKALAKDFTVPDIHVHCEIGDLVLDFKNISTELCENSRGCEVSMSGSVDQNSSLLTLNVDMSCRGHSDRFTTVFIESADMSKIRIINYDASRIVDKIPTANNHEKFFYNHTNYTREVISPYSINSSGTHFDTKQTYSLVISPEPILRHSNHAFMYFTDCDFEYNQTVHFEKSIFDLELYRENNTLLATNMRTERRYNLLIMYLHDYYVNEKLKTIHFVGGDGIELDLTRPAADIEEFHRRIATERKFYDEY